MANTGIVHLRTGDSQVACKKRNAIMWVAVEAFVHEPRQCMRCAAIFARRQAKRTKGGDAS